MESKVRCRRIRRAATADDIGSLVFVSDDGEEWLGPYELRNLWEGAPYPYSVMTGGTTLPYFAYAELAEPVGRIPEAHLRGHGIWWDKEAEVWRYCDTDEPAEGNDRPCARCSQPPTENDHDPCLPSLPGVRNACCGHGWPDSAYIQFEDGRTVRGFHTVEPPMEDEA